MCGIAGVAYASDGLADRAQVERMCEVIRHRGPDDEGIFVDGPVGLGMRRLSIIDIATGHQPIHNEGRTVWVVLNGEIYNFESLRQELLQLGHHFYTQSDTETLVHLYEQYGQDMVRRLNGMFAFAIWDCAKRRLFIARDRLGEKQLFYSFQNGKLLFGSELKCLLATGEPSREIDLRAVDEYFTFLYTPAPRTIYRDIHELPPGHTLVLDEKGLQLQRYWQLAFIVNRETDERYFVDTLTSKFQQAVRSRMVSDVPLGALLSGGVDSSAIVAAMAESGEVTVKTFCIGYGNEGADFDERQHARLVARHFGTEHHEFVVKPRVVEELPHIVRAFDQPFADSSAIVNYYVYRETRKHVKVVLSGLGGDEVAAGYERHLGMRLRHRYRMLPRFFREQVLENVVAALPASALGSRFVERAKRFVRTGRLADDQAYLQIQSAFNETQRDSLFTSDFSDRLSRAPPSHDFIDYFNHDGIADTLNRVLFTDLMTYLPGDLLALTDRMSMAHSVEARAPFLDHELVEFMATVPPELKIRGLTKKYLLKQSLKGRLPSDILQRRKQGFTAPLSVWFRNELVPLMRSVLSQERIESVGYFNWPTVARLLDEHIAGRENHHSRIWALLMFMMWHDADQQSKY